MLQPSTCPGTTREPVGPGATGPMDLRRPSSSEGRPLIRHSADGRELAQAVRDPLDSKGDGWGSRRLPALRACLPNVVELLMHEGADATDLRGDHRHHPPRWPSPFRRDHLRDHPRGQWGRSRDAGWWA